MVKCQRHGHLCGCAKSYIYIYVGGGKITNMEKNPSKSERKPNFSKNSGGGHGTPGPYGVAGSDVGFFSFIQKLRNDGTWEPVWIKYERPPTIY